MNAYRRIGLGCLLGVCLAAGFAARLESTAREQALGSARRSPGSTPGVLVAAARLEGASVDLRPLAVMLTVLKSLREHYVDQITPEDEGRMAYDSLRAMLSSLEDPNTRFLDPAQHKLASDAAEGAFHGIGAVLSIKKLKTGDFTEEHLVVVTPIQTGPAAKAGVKPGDDITAVNGRDVLPYNPYRKAEEMVKKSLKTPSQKSQLRKSIDAEAQRVKSGIPILEAENLLMSEDGKEVELSIIRKGSPKPVKVKIDGRSFSVAPVTSELLEHGKLGYVRINCFTNDAPEQFQKALRELRSGGAAGLVLDLRNLAGGTIDSAVGIARPLIPGGVLAVERKSRGRKSTIRVPECNPEDAWRGPIVVLVNSGTARIAEVLAAALRDGASAKLVGEKTYGDCSVVTIIEQKDGSAISMTTGVLVPVKSADYQGKGLPVDVSVPSTGSGDVQLKEAVRVLAAMISSEKPSARSSPAGGINGRKTAGAAQHLQAAAAPACRPAARGRS